LKTILPKGVEKEFFDFLANLTTKDVRVYAVDEGKVVFPKVPLLRVEGPLAIVQLLETTLLNLVNYARYLKRSRSSQFLDNCCDNACIDVKYVIFLFNVTNAH
jgi:nicotinic acid phosphoribosyltransferase